MAFAKKGIIFFLFFSILRSIAWGKPEDLVPVHGPNNKVGFVDSHGKVVIPFQFYDAEPFHEGLSLAAKVNALGYLKWGYINEKGEWVIPPQFDVAKPFSEGLAGVGYQHPRYKPNERVFAPMIQTVWGFINEKGEFVIKPQFKEVSFFSEGIAPACIAKGCGYINEKGDWVIPAHYLSTFPFHEGLAVVFTGKFGYIDKTGKWVVKPEYDDACEFHEGLACVSNFSKNKGLYGYIGKNGKVVLPFKFEVAGNFSEGLAFVEKMNTCGYIDHHGKMKIILPQNTVAEADLSRQWAYFSDGRALVKIQTPKGRRFGYINKKGEWVIPPQFEDALPFRNGIAVVRRDGNLFLLDTNGKIIWH